MDANPSNTEIKIYRANVNSEIATAMSTNQSSYSIIV